MSSLLGCFKDVKLFWFSLLHLSFTLALGISSSWANLPDKISRDNIPGRVKTQMTLAEQEQEARDAQRFPHLMKLIQSVDVTEHIYPTDPRNQKWIPSQSYFNPAPELWQKFFVAAAQDKVTCMRAFVLMARELKKSGVAMFGPGAPFEKAVAQNQIDLGLAIPAKNVGAAIWTPDPSNKDPEFLVHMKVFYSKTFTHEFPDDILPANLKIGTGKKSVYYWDGQSFNQPSIDADIYYGPRNGIGFRNVRGISGQKRGVVGFLQKVLFFLPDAIHSMTIQADKDVLITEALVNTAVKDFEKNPNYAIKVKAE